MTKTHIGLQPQYMGEFSCIGAECEDTCCQAWTITIDKETYKKYKNLPESPLKKKIIKSMGRIRKDANDYNYAKMKLDDQARCPLMTEQKLCGIQLELGERYLSHTCTVYPRQTNMVDGRIELSAAVSCPEVARLALLNPAGIDFDELEIEIEAKTPIFSILNTKAHGRDELAFYFWDLRFFTIKLLQNRMYSVADRLVLLGIFFDKLENIVQNKKIRQLPALIQEFEARVEAGKFLKDLSLLKIPSIVQLTITKGIASMMKGVNKNNRRYMECLHEMLEGLGYNEDIDEEARVQRYTSAYEKYYQPFMEQHDYIYENYMVNYVYRSMFPMKNTTHPFENFITLTVHFALIKLHLVGIAAFHKELTPSSVIRVIQILSRTVEHNHIYIKEIHKVLESHQFDNLAYLSVLIKN
ncbi:flagellin lysine-N-methylase [Aneurinibacillus uraniidurans]|uniref:flagellin lysine-N-methylase n=1 Tax=Aneurinibacillus uraniidurans TaxID=2966586 RepID=UPI0023495070|nr:flagellin lysine-N-methylase [Aneurinibacillus sp. B1]WCN38157.1 flagellin lysine-N-methylase [Aneurinibacillus sp. B1]